MDIEEQRRRNAEKQRAWRAKHCQTPEQRAKRAAYMREYWRRNPEKAKEKAKQYREEHREEIAAKLRADRKLRPEYYRAIDAKKTAKRKPAILAQMRIYNGRAEVKRRARYTGALRRYGLTPEQFDQMLIDSCGRCTICNRIFDHVKEPAIDHCHRVGKIRGLLCVSCNNGLGRFFDSPDLLEAAAQYLRS
jgi:hypothetical protein